MRRFQVCVLLSVVVIAGCRSLPTSAPQQASPMVDNIRAHDRLVEKPLSGSHMVFTWQDGREESAYVSCSSEADTRPLVHIHFHGSAIAVEHAAEKTNRPVKAVAINFGAGSSRYEQPLSKQSAWIELLSALRNTNNQACDLNWDHAEVVVTSFSAGYGAVRAILRSHPESIDGLILLDGLHTDYVSEDVRMADGGLPRQSEAETGGLNTEKLEPFVSFAQEALEGSKRMLVTHSSVFPGTYASTTETADYLLEKLDLERKPVLEWGPVGMQLVSRTSKGHLTVLGFAGNTAPDHIDHLHGLPVFLRMVLSDQ